MVSMYDVAMSVIWLIVGEYSGRGREVSAS